jgi:hypothetical protein
VIATTHTEHDMNATIERLALQAAVNPAVLHILSRNLDVLEELRSLTTTRSFGVQLEAYVDLEGEPLDDVLAQIRDRVIEMWQVRRPVLAVRAA